MSLSAAKRDLLQELRDRIAACSGTVGAPAPAVCPTGLPALDAALPWHGLHRGTLIELLDDRDGSGAETLAVRLLLALNRPGNAAVILDPDRQLFPPALAAWGVPLERVIVIHPANDAEALWAADQALRNRAVAVAWWRCDRLRPHDGRRLRLAAEEGGGVGLLFRPAKLRGQPTCADLQLIVRPARSPDARRLHVEIARCRGGTGGTTVELRIDDVLREVPHETLRVSAATQLADSTTVLRAAGVTGPAGHPSPPRRAARGARSRR